MVGVVEEIEIAGEVVGVAGGGVVAVDAPRNTMEAVEEIMHITMEAAEAIQRAMSTTRCT
jgi:shikimate kinase